MNFLLVPNRFVSRRTRFFFVVFFCFPFAVLLTEFLFVVVLVVSNFYWRFIWLTFVLCRNNGDARTLIAHFVIYDDSRLFSADSALNVSIYL